MKGVTPKDKSESSVRMKSLILPISHHTSIIPARNGKDVSPAMYALCSCERKPLMLMKKSDKDIWMNNTTLMFNIFEAVIGKNKYQLHFITDE